MSNFKKLMMSTAGGEPGLDVNEVFSATAYDGNGGASQNIENGIALGDSYRGTSTQFYGSDGYLSSSSTMSGASNSKTFTFSIWVKLQPRCYTTFTQIYTARTSSNSQEIVSFIQSGGLFFLSFNNPAAFGNGIVRLWFNSTLIPRETWTHILYSADASDTNKRHLYINDTLVTPTYGQYNNYNVLFGDSDEYYVGAANSTFHNLYGNVAHVYNDTTYRNLGTTSNRRLFIDANGGSTATSTLSALNPFIYLPLTEDYSIGVNLGTGGNFTVNGSPTIEQTGTKYEVGYGQGGMVLVKRRDSAQSWILHDSEMNTDDFLMTSNADPIANYGSSSVHYIKDLTSTGFIVGNQPEVNTGEIYGSWTFRKAPKFFDMVTYTGTGSARTVSHNLGSVPAVMIIKRLDTTSSDWNVYHKDLGNTKRLLLNANAQAYDIGSVCWNSTTPTSSVFSLGTNSGVNANGSQYVAYLFAHNDGDGEFGPDLDQDIIKCGSYTNISSSNVNIDLGWEPQWILIKNATDSGDWNIIDNMRGFEANETTNRTAELSPNTTAAETEIRAIQPTQTGFYVQNGIDGNYNSGNPTGTRTYVYIAIRRGPMAVPKSADEVFAIDTEGGIGGGFRPTYRSGFPVDMGLYKDVDGFDWQLYSRITGKDQYRPNLDTAASTSQYFFAYNDGYQNGLNQDTTRYSWMWRRAPQFFDVVTYKGDGTTDRTFNHKLGVKPGMIWLKNRFRSVSGSTAFWVWVDNSATTNEGRLSNNGDFGAEIIGTVTDTTVQTRYTGQFASNYNNDYYVAYLFGSVAGVSKVGSYTGNGSSQTINCGFTNGARFVLIKRTDDSGSWCVFDAERGIVSGNDSVLYLQLANAQVTSLDWIDPDSSGFALANGYGNTNASGGTYIFYAIAA